jgi:glycosyltransferase involved in cell wall biosynthesis
MRILMTADTVGGVWVYALELVAALAEVDPGIEVVLATMGGRMNATQRAAAHGCRHLHVVESDYKLEWMQEPWGDVDAAGDWLLDLERDHHVDLVHLNGFAHGALPWRSPVVVVAHSCVRSWWRAVYHSAAPAEWDEYTRRVRHGLRAASLVVAPSHAMLQALWSEYGSLPRAEVIPNGRDARHFAATSGGKEPFVLSAGRLWDPSKNVRLVDAAAPTLRWPVYVAGAMVSPDGRRADFEHSKALGELASGELAGWMARASVYALPARYEPFGLSIVEAALSGCALVLGDIPSLRELWGDAASYADPDDAAALARAINWLADDPGLRRARAARAHRRAVEMSPARMANGYVDAYRRARTANTRNAARGSGEVLACAS